jgi:hypothetical protein
MNYNLFNTQILSLYSQNIKELILKKNSDTAITRILTDYIYDINDINSSVNDELKTFTSIVKSPILFLHLLRELNYSNIRQLMINTKNMSGNINFLAKMFRYLNINCLKIFNINNTDNYYYGVDKYCDYDVVDNDLMMITTNKVEKLQISTLNNDVPEIIIVQRFNENVDEALIVKKIISDPDNEKILNLNNIDMANYNNIKSMKDIITYNDRQYKLDACIILLYENEKYLTYLNHKDKKYICDINVNVNTIQTNWINNFSTTKNNIIAIYVLL